MILVANEIYNSIKHGVNIRYVWFGIQKKFKNISNIAEQLICYACMNYLIMVYYAIV